MYDARQEAEIAAARGRSHVGGNPEWHQPHISNIEDTLQALVYAVLYVGDEIAKGNNTMEARNGSTQDA